MLNILFGSAIFLPGVKSISVLNRLLGSAVFPPGVYSTLALNRLLGSAEILRQFSLRLLSVRYVIRSIRSRAERLLSDTRSPRAKSERRASWLAV